MLIINSKMEIFCTSIFIFVFILTNVVYAQRNWRQVYLTNPKSIKQELIKRNDVVENSYLGKEYEQGSIWPMPQEEERSKSTFFTFDPKKFRFKGVNRNKILLNAFQRYSELLFPNEDLRPDNSLKKIEALEVEVEDYRQPLTLDSNEEYKLNIKSPISRLSAKSVWGALRGLETFSQTVYQKGSSYRVAENEILDYPRFKYRGFLIDTGRHYLPARTILQFLDAMAYSKFNVLHWHIVDDPSFPYVSKTFPELHRRGAFNPNTHVYQPSDVQRVIEYARLRGIRVLPEFNTPGHTSSWRGIPNLLINCYSKTIHQKGQINPLRGENYDFLQRFFTEIDDVFPDEYLHIGGNEVDYGCWLQDEEIRNKFGNDIDRAGNKTVFAALHNYYHTGLIKIMKKLKKRYIVWQDVFDSGVRLDNEAVVHVWRPIEWQKELFDVTKAGHQAILTSCWNLDNITYGLDWPPLYHCDPQKFGGSIKQNKLILGGSAAIWGEFVDATNVIPRSFGRAFAIAERLWSSDGTTDLKDALPRIWEQHCRYVSRGIPAEPVTRNTHCKKEWTNNY